MKTAIAMKAILYLSLSLLLVTCSSVESIQVHTPIDVVLYEALGNTAAFEPLESFADLGQYLDSVFNDLSQTWALQADSSRYRHLSGFQQIIGKLVNNDAQTVAQSAIVPIALPDVDSLFVKLSLGTISYSKSKKSDRSRVSKSNNSSENRNDVKIGIQIDVIQQIGSKLTTLFTKSLEKEGVLETELEISQYGILIPTPFTYPSYNTDSIYSELLKEAEKSSAYPDVALWLRNYADSMKDHGNSAESFFPYGDFDTVCIFRVNEGYFNGLDHNFTFDNLSKDTFQLSSEQITRLLRFMNNPLNFSWGECGTAIPQYQIQFLLDGKVVNQHSLACNHGQFSLGNYVGDINYLRIRYGAVNYEKRQQLIDILKESGAYFYSEF